MILGEVLAESLIARLPPFLAVGRELAKLEDGVFVFKASQRVPEGEIKPSSSRMGRIAKASGCKLDRDAVRVMDLGHSCNAWTASLNNGWSDSW